MLDRVMMVLFTHPWIARGAGRALMALAAFMAMRGLWYARFGRRLARVFSGSGVEAPDVLGSLPPWLWMLTPETTVNWIGVALLFVSGAYLFWIGRWLKRFGT